jgi:hypothetical protein
MWADEINDPEYQDMPELVTTATKPKREKRSKKDGETYVPDYQDLHYQPITSLHRPILDAITGEASKYLIGSKDEKRFYCVMTNDPFDPKESCRLFFASPQDYEQFSGVTVSEESIRRFREDQVRFSSLSFQQKV